MAAIAGAPPDLAIRIGAAMTLLQLGIGATNDVVDAPHDSGRKPNKPIPAGLVSAAAARIAAVALFVAGVLLAATVSLQLAGVAAVVVGIGLAYDLWLKGTAWSWLPFAIGIPILPVFGWIGGTGGIHRAFGLLVPAAVAAGTALAIGNALVDVERDRDAGRTSVAARLGAGPATAVTVALFVLVAIAAVWSAAAVGTGLPVLGALFVAGCLPAVAAVVAGSRAPADRELAWRVEALAVAALAVLWVRVVLV